MISKKCKRPKLKGLTYNFIYIRFKVREMQINGWKEVASTL